MIRAGIVGLGRWGRQLVDSVQGRSDRIRFVAAATGTPAKAEEYCADNEIALLEDYSAVLADPQIDAVALATPHTQHFAQIMAAADAGKHVFSEKPFTLSRSEAETALEALAKAGLKAAVGHNRRFAPNTVELKRMIDTGTLGQLVHFEGVFSSDMSPRGDNWRNDRQESPAGGMTSLGIHVIDAFIHLCGRIDGVHAVSKHIALPFDIDDSTSALLAFENGCSGTLSTVASTAMIWAIRVSGTKGWAEIREQNRIEWLLTEGTHDAIDYPGYDYPAPATVAAGLEAFAEDVEGGAPFPIPPAQIRHGVAAMEAIFQSVERSGVVVPVA